MLLAPSSNSLPQMDRIMADFIDIEVMQSTYDSKYRALSVDGIRCGPDAGPWRVVDTFRVSVDTLKRVVDRACDHDGRAPNE